MSDISASFILPAASRTASSRTWTVSSETAFFKTVRTSGVLWRTSAFKEDMRVWGFSLRQSFFKCGSVSGWTCRTKSFRACWRTKRSELETAPASVFFASDDDIFSSPTAAARLTTWYSSSRDFVNAATRILISAASLVFHCPARAAAARSRIEGLGSSSSGGRSSSKAFLSPRTASASRA